MVVDAPTQTPTDRVLHLSAYVERSLDAVLDAFAASRIDELLGMAVQAALDASDGALISAHASTPVWVSASHANVCVTWCAKGSAASGPREGTADLSLLMVQSGVEAITELLVALPIDEAIAAPATIIMHRVLDELTARLEAEPAA